MQFEIQGPLRLTSASSQGSRRGSGEPCFVNFSNSRQVLLQRPGRAQAPTSQPVEDEYQVAFTLT